MVARILMTVLLLFVAACVDTPETASTDGITTSSTRLAETTTEASAASTPSTEGSLPTTTTAGPPTTAAVPATAVPSTTTTTLPVITGPNTPEARAGAEIPWSQVGPGWHVALYDASRANPTGPGDVEDRPVLAYMVSPEGVLYQAAGWPATKRPWSIADLAGALLLVVGSTREGQAFSQVVDLRDGSKTSVDLPDTTPLDGPWPPVGLTRPTGKNLIVWGSDGTDEWLERWAFDATVLAHLYGQPYTGFSGEFSWLYRYDGSMVVVGHDGGMAYVRNSGEIFRELSIPHDRACEPVRWWDANTVLARCRPNDSFTYHFQLWLISTDGMPAQPLTAFEEDPDVVDFGYTDAWPSGDITLVQWAGDCGASALQVLQPDGTGQWLDTHWMEGIDGYRLLDVVDDVATIYAWRGCDASEGELNAVALDGALLRRLVPVVGDARGVIDAAGLATVYP